MYIRTEGRAQPAFGSEAGDAVRACSNCDRPATREGEPATLDFAAVYACTTCGQREAVSWRSRLPWLVEEIRVVEGPHIILGEH